MPLYPASEPFAQWFLEVGDGNLIYWEASGNPLCKPALVVHGGPGSGSSTGSRKYFDPEHYMLINFDQRGCGRSTPHASDPATDMSVNTTHHLIRDMEILREHLNVDKWMLFGGSWGSTLSIAYAEQFPERVSEMILVSVTLSRPSEIDWLYRGVSRFLPEQWESFRGHVDTDKVIEAYANLMESPSIEIRQRAAAEWVRWEDAVIAHETNGTPHSYSSKIDNDRLGFVRICSHYFSHDVWLTENQLLESAHLLNGIPGILIHGQLDLGTPLKSAWDLKNAWQASELIVVPDSGHTGNQEMRDQLFAAIERFK